MARQESTDERLARIPLFEGLSKRQLSQVSSLMTPLDLKAGKVRTEGLRAGPPATTSHDGASGSHYRGSWSTPTGETFRVDLRSVP
jgi:hypothetical protein